MKQRLLIAEDDRLLAEAAGDYFTGKGWDVHTAENGDRALELLVQNRYHLILLDVMMPGCDGFTLCRQIRRDSSVPIIFITARVLEEDQLHGYSLGADDYVTKPFSLPQLCGIFFMHFLEFPGQFCRISIHTNRLRLYESCDFLISYLIPLL